MKVSHEVPRCLLTASPEFNDYDYCLPHLLDIDEDYKQYFINARDTGRYVIMDNSLHELGEAYDFDRLKYWVNELEPDEFMVPDVWMDCHQTAAQAKYWKQFEFPEKTKKIAVIQGKDKNDAYLCAGLLIVLKTSNLSSKFSFKNCLHFSSLKKLYSYSGFKSIIFFFTFVGIFPCNHT